MPMVMVALQQYNDKSSYNKKNRNVKTLCKYVYLGIETFSQYFSGASTIYFELD